MSGSKARLTFHGRLLLVQRVLEQQWPVAHAAKAQGVWRQCAHRWINRYRAQGAAGLHDRCAAPHRRPTRTTSVLERGVVALRVAERRGPDWIAAETGVPARTVSRILRRHAMPCLHQLDPLTGVVIRASKTTALRYEHPYPGSLVHTDVKKIGRIADGGGWRVHGRAEKYRGRGIGYDFVHCLVDDYSRYAYCEILPDQTGATTAGFLARALDAFATAAITVERLMSDNHLSYSRCTAVGEVLATRGIRHVFIRPHCPWHNGKVERFNPTLHTDWAYRQPFTSNQSRADALAPWLHHYNTERTHTALKGQPPISRPSPT